MNAVVLTKTYPEPPLNEREMLRYAGCRSADAETLALLRSALEELRPLLTYKVCYRELPVRTDPNGCDLGTFRLPSKGLARNLSGCERALLFAATIGPGADRLIQRYTRLSPARAVLLQAIGAERIEALCDAFCQEMEQKLGAPLTPRFSPGYGDLPLDTQPQIFALLDCSKRIGLCLNSSLLMSPSKSVTAFAGIKGEPHEF